MLSSLCRQSCLYPCTTYQGAVVTNYMSNHFKWIKSYASILGTTRETSVAITDALKIGRYDTFTVDTKSTSFALRKWTSCNTDGTYYNGVSSHGAPMQASVCEETVVVHGLLQQRKDGPGLSAARTQLY